MSHAVPISIRDYRIGDAAAMARVFFLAVRALGSRRYSPAQVAVWAPVQPDPRHFAARAGDGRRTLVAVDPTNTVVAFGDLEPNGHIDLLYCHPDLAGTGVASRLVKALLSHARAACMKRLHVEASELARGLFARHGFEVKHRRDFLLDNVPIHNFLMTRALD